MSDVKRGRPTSKALFADGTYDIDHFHKVFIEMEDLTEYKPAIELVGSWEEWKRLKSESRWFESHVMLWLEEVKTIIKSRAFQKIQEIAQGKNATASSAAKWIAEESWEISKGKGRPSKSDKTKEARRLAEAAADTEGDIKRMLEVVNGGKTD